MPSADSKDPVPVRRVAPGVAREAVGLAPRKVVYTRDLTPEEEAARAQKAERMERLARRLSGRLLLASTSILGLSIGYRGWGEGAR